MTGFFIWIQSSKIYGMNSIETKDLSFSYGKQRILSNLSLQIPQGSIYGYLGPNGAGKTTTFLLILGLLGSRKNISVCGFRMDKASERMQAYTKIGFFVNPFFVYEHLTARENLECLNVFYKKQKSHVDETLEKVGLLNACNKKVSRFSSGMKQRLAIGIAIFNQPEILLLDEPVNGLDPVGIYEMRELFLSLNHAGMTIFFSSHILSEIERICTHIGILNNTRLLYQGSLIQLIKEGNKDSLENIYLDLIRKSDDSFLATI